MIKRLAIAIIFICAFTSPEVRAQINYVLNPSFEQHTLCPDFPDQVRYATWWNCIDTNFHVGDPILIGCVPEYINVCGGPSSIVYPINNYFHHWPRTGDGMMHAAMFAHWLTNGGDLDYLQGKLKTALTAGETYCLTFYVATDQISGWAVNKIGAYLDDGTIDTTVWQNCGGPLTYCHPQVFTNTVIYDTLGWVKIQGSFVANGTERFITIGNFFDRTDVDSMEVVVPDLFALPSPPGNYMSYYLVDDVSLLPVSANANAGPDKFVTIGGDSVLIGTPDGYLPCKWYASGVLIDSNCAGLKVHPATTTTYVMVLDVCGTEKRDTVVVKAVPAFTPLVSIQNIQIFPTPSTNGRLTVSGVAVSTRYNISNSIGMNMQSGSIAPPGEELNIENLPTGGYLLRLQDEFGNGRTVKIIR